MSSTVSRHLSRLFAVTALILVAVAGYQLWVPAPLAGRLVVDPTVTDFGVLPIGEHRIVVTRVTNFGGGPARVLGISESCGLGACYAPIDPGPLVVPAGEGLDIACLVTLREEGPVRFQVQLFLDNGKFAPVSVRVNGIARPSQGGGADGSQQNGP